MYESCCRYPENSKNQLKLLLKYARRRRRWPLYAFYAEPDETGGPGCQCIGATDGAVFIADAQTINDFADGKHGKRISKGALLRVSRPFHCWFCCLPLPAKYLNGHSNSFPFERGDHFRTEILPTSGLPQYVKDLADSEQSRLTASSASEDSKVIEWPKVRRVAAYDLRRED
jgi:hypothetical protein